MPRVLWGSYGVGHFLMSEVPLYLIRKNPPLSLQGLLEIKDTHRRTGVPRIRSLRLEGRSVDVFLF